MINKLYGDGIHDDLPAIQEMLDSGAACVYLPMPQKNYTITAPIRINSNQELKLDRYAKVCLAPGSDCVMLTNSTPDKWNENISVNGGIWDMNHKEQSPNPLHFSTVPNDGLKLGEYMNKIGYDRVTRQTLNAYTGMCFVFNSVRRLNFANLTILNPVTFGADFSYVEDFTIENIYFDYYDGSPKLWNMDGVHIEGFCKNGVIRNLHGACHDDMVAITADDFLHGPIENILVDGLYSQNCHSAVRLLSYKSRVRNIHITNVFGTYYACGIVMSKYHESDDKSYFENITIDHIHASFCKGTVDVPGNRRPLIYIADNMDIKSLYLSHIFRDETHISLPTVGIMENTKIGILIAECVQQTNTVGKDAPFVENNGSIDNLVLNKIDVGTDSLIVNEGTIKNIVCENIFSGKQN